MSNNQSPITDHRLPTTDFIGWRLDEAQIALQSDPRTKDYPVQVVTTAPPRLSRENRKQVAAKTKKGKDVAIRQSQPTQFGEWRVLRCRVIAASPADESSSDVRVENRENIKSIIEVLVAREQIAARQAE